MRATTKSVSEAMPYRLLHRPWQMMGALEAVDGMLLFGVSTAYLFAVMQVHWSMLTAHATRSES